MKKIITVAFLVLITNFCNAKFHFNYEKNRNQIFLFSYQVSRLQPSTLNSPNGGQALEPSTLLETIRIIFQNNSGKKGTMKFKLTIENPDGAKRIEELIISGDESIRKELNVEIGSKVYVDNGYKLNTLVGGKVPSKDAPFMIVMPRDKNQTINLIEEKNVSEVVVLANAAKSAEKLKITNDAKVDYVVTGNIVTVTYKGGNGSTLAEFDCDKKNGNVKNINDLRKK